MMDDSESPQIDLERGPDREFGVFVQKISRSADGPEAEQVIFPALPAPAQNVVEHVGSGTWLASVGRLD